MAANMRQRHKNTLLSIQITQAERQVLHRRQLVGVRTSKFGQNLRRRLASPAVLLLAGSIGFATGHLPTQPASRPETTQRPRAARSKFFEQALKLIAFARILTKVFPSADMDPSAQSGLPGQAPAPKYRSAAA